MVAMPSASLFNRCGIGMMLSTVMGEAVFVDLHRGSHFAGLLFHDRVILTDANADHAPLSTSMAIRNSRSRSEEADTGDMVYHFRQGACVSVVNKISSKPEMSRLVSRTSRGHCSSLQKRPKGGLRRRVAHRASACSVYFSGVASISFTNSRFCCLLSEPQRRSNLASRSSSV